MTILDEINEVKKEEVKKLRKNFTLSRFSDSEFFSKKKLSFSKSVNREDQISIIAEIKKASPSKGIIRDDFNHLDIAEIYMENAVAAISVLTDENFFKGSLKYLYEIAKIKNVPLLRKDFIIDEYQVYEAKANGADVILLIAESLSPGQLNELTSAAEENNLEVLVELHSKKQVGKIDFNNDFVLGINNRDLSNFSVDLNTTAIIEKYIPENKIIISESGIKTEKDIDFIKGTRARAILIGEHLISSEDISASLKNLKKWCANES